MEVLRHRPRSEIAEIRYIDRRLDIMTLEEFLKALREGKAVTGDGGRDRLGGRIMTSKEALKDIFDILMNFERLSDIHDEQDIKKQKFEIIEEDLDLLEEYRKLEEEIGVDFITLVKMLKDDVYINDGGIVDEIGNIYKERVKSIEH